MRAGSISLVSIKRSPRIPAMSLSQGCRDKMRVNKEVLNVCVRGYFGGNNDSLRDMFESEKGSNVYCVFAFSLGYCGSVA
jgi:hypothetical protein